MKISGKNNRRYLPVILAVLLIAVMAKHLIPISETVKESEFTQRYFCDAERIEGENFIGEFGVFSNAYCQSDEKALNGDFSCKCSKEVKYGFTRKLEGLKSGDTLIYSVWANEDDAEGTLVFSSDLNDMYIASTKIAEQRSGWKKLSDTIVIPLYFRQGRTVIYPVVLNGDGSVYFDDLEILVVPSSGEEIVPPYEGANLELQLTHENYSKIIAKKNEAWDIGLLFTSREDLVDADIRIGDKNYGARVRLKGDLLDHLRNGKYSFRIELKGDKEWKGMKTFSIHNSLSRSHLAEWYMHELFKKEEIITPDYDFINFSLNGKNLGVYAYEQHFDNNLLEKSKRPIGPIIRHTDDGYWENVNKKIKPFHWTSSSQIELFNKENAGDPEFVKLYDTAHSMLNDFIHGRKKVRDVFDLDKMARYFALLETSHAVHAQLFTNIRFYLNPYTGLLEPIGFDCFGDVLPNVNKNWTAMGEGYNRNWESEKFIETGNEYKVYLFEDNDFYASYIRHLLYYTSKEYLESRKQELQNEALARAIFIRSDEEYKNYKESWDQVFLKSEFNRKKIFPKSNFSLTAYIRDNTRSKVQLHSFHFFPLEILGFVTKDGPIELDSSIIMEAYNPGVENDFVNIDLDQPAYQVRYRTLGTDSVFIADIPKINAPVDNVPVVQSSPTNLANLDFLTIEGNKITFDEGIHTVSNPIVLPKGYNISFLPGTELNFENDACIISYARIQAIGSEKHPIKFKGTGGKNAIYILESEEKSRFKNCIFYNLGKFGFRNIQTDGAVSVYKSKVEFEDCFFTDIMAKDALNIVMSQCTLYNTDFKTCKGDLLDSYYSNIFVRDITAERVGKDGIELTGGELNAENIRFKNVLRSGVRAMDMANVTVQALNFTDGEIALYASSHSKVYVNQMNLSNVKRGVELLSENDPHTEATIVRYKGENVEQEYIIQENSILNINNSRKKAF